MKDQMVLDKLVELAETRSRANMEVGELNRKLFDAEERAFDLEQDLKEAKDELERAKQELDKTWDSQARSSHLAGELERTKIMLTIRTNERDKLLSALLHNLDPSGIELPDYMQELSADRRDRIRRILAAYREGCIELILAIKLVRDGIELGLKETKELVKSVRE